MFNRSLLLTLEIRLTNMRVRVRNFRTHIKAGCSVSVILAPPWRDRKLEPENP